MRSVKPCLISDCFCMYRQISWWSVLGLWYKSLELSSNATWSTCNHCQPYVFIISNCYFVSEVLMYHLTKNTRRFMIFWQNISKNVWPNYFRCQFPSGALTGNLNVDHAMCVLSLNIINDKIFLLEWLWFALLSILTLFSLFSTLIFVMFPSFRRFWIR